MAVENFICESCLCTDVCAVKGVLLKFSDEVKKPLPTDIQILNCKNYKQIETEE